MGHAMMYQIQIRSTITISLSTTQNLHTTALQTSTQQWEWHLSTKTDILERLFLTSLGNLMALIINLCMESTFLLPKTLLFSLMYPPTSHFPEIKRCIYLQSTMLS